MADPQDPPTPPPDSQPLEHMIPKSRFDEVISERDTTRAKLEEATRRLQRVEEQNRIISTQHQFARHAVEIDEASAKFVADWYAGATKGVDNPPALVELAKSDKAPVMLRSLFAQQVAAGAPPAAPPAGAPVPAAAVTPPAQVRQPPPDVVSGTRESPPGKAAMSPADIKAAARAGRLPALARKP
jgi:hypothetical protein